MYKRQSYEGPLFRYKLDDRCKAILFSKSDVVGYLCKHGQGYFVQIGTLIYGQFNSDIYSFMDDVPARRDFLQSILDMKKNFSGPLIRIKDGGDRVTHFARSNKERKTLWLTIKSARTTSVDVNLVLTEKVLDEICGKKSFYQVVDPFTGEVRLLERKVLITDGLPVELQALDSQVRIITPTSVQ